MLNKRCSDLRLSDSSSCMDVVFCTEISSLVTVYLGCHLMTKSYTWSISDSQSVISIHIQNATYLLVPSKGTSLAIIGSGLLSRLPMSRSSFNAMSSSVNVHCRGKGASVSWEFMKDNSYLCSTFSSRWPWGSGTHADPSSHTSWSFVDAQWRPENEWGTWFINTWKA